MLSTLHRNYANRHLAGLLGSVITESRKCLKLVSTEYKDLKKREREAKFLIELLKEILKPIPKHHFAGISSKRSRRCSLPYLIAKAQIHLI